MKCLSREPGLFADVSPARPLQKCAGGSLGKLTPNMTFSLSIWKDQVPFPDEETTGASVGMLRTFVWGVFWCPWLSVQWACRPSVGEGLGCDVASLRKACWLGESLEGWSQSRAGGSRVQDPGRGVPPVCLAEVCLSHAWQAGPQPPSSFMSQSCFSWDHRPCSPCWEELCLLCQWVFGCRAAANNSSKGRGRQQQGSP